MAPPPTTDGDEPVQRAEDGRVTRRIVAPWSFRRSSQTRFTRFIEFFGTPSEAEARLDTVLEDEPSWRDVLYVEPVQLVRGGEN